MKSNRLLLNTLLTFVLIASAFLVSVPPGYAQADQDDWSEPVNLSLSGAATNPVMVVDSRGATHVIWVDEVDEGYKYSNSRDGVTWSQAQSVEFPFDPQDPSPVLFAGENGAIHVFWLSSDQSSSDQSSSDQSSSVRSLFYGRITPGDFAYPDNWILISRLADSVVSFDVVVDAQGAFHVAYIQNAIVDVNPIGVYYVQSPSGGGFWLQPRKLYQSDYFSSARQSDLYVRISTSNTLSNQKVFVSWDNRAQKRVFMAISEDSGMSWSDVQQIKGAEDTGGINTPFNLTVSAYGRNVLLIWNEGDPGRSICTVYSQWSDDGGVNWGDAVAVLGGRSECPLSTKVIGRDSNYMSVMLIGQLSPIMVAWNGVEWSDIQSQIQLPSLVNPLTFDAILLGCRFDLLNKNRLYVVGCDQGLGNDVWFLSRTLDSVENWFSSSVVWGDPYMLSLTFESPEKISNFYSIPDHAGNIHAVWVNSLIRQENLPDATIKYARWDGRQWTNPESIITSLRGEPVQVSLTSDSLKKLFLTWIDGYNGDLNFNWANLERAELSSEWAEVTDLPAPSRLINSSDIIVDGSGRIIVAYSVPINEERGIYIVQSIDNGTNWSQPVRVFDAVSTSWEEVGQVRIGLAADGTLHLIYIRDTVREGQTVGLYYSRSEDGGATWSDAQPLSEGEIQWADIASYGDQIVHVVWQEYDGLVYANVSQVSQDGGETWGKQNSVTGVNNSPTQVSLASNGNGSIHFIQLISKDDTDAYNKKSFVLQDWKWNGTAWILELTRDLAIKGEGVTYSLSAELTSTGYLGVFIPVEYTDSAGGFKGEILTLSRFLEDAADDQPLQVPVIPTTIITASVGEETSAFQPTQTPDFSILYNDNVSTTPLQRNIVGLVLIGVGVVATLILLMWRRPSINK